MHETEVDIESTDGLRLFAREWRPDEPARGVICVLHGLGEHSGQYEEVADAFEQKSIALIGLDLRGHGQSAGQRGHIPSYSALLDDVDALLAKAAERHPGVPRFLYGHSLGGNLALNHAIRRQPDVAGVIATGAWFWMTKDLALYKRFLASLLEPVWPTLSFSTGTSGDDSLESDGLRRNADLFHRRITLRLLMEMRRAGLWAVRNADLLTTPALLIHGALDPVTAPKGTMEFARRAGATCQGILLSGVGHNPHEEDESTIPALVEWVNERLLSR